LKETELYMFSVCFVNTHLYNKQLYTDLSTQKRL